MPGPFQGRKCQNRECGRHFSNELDRCPTCYVAWEDPVTYTSLQLTRMHHSRITTWNNQGFIARRFLALYDDYAEAWVGDIIAVQGHGGQDMFFELAGYIEGWGDEPEPAFLLIRVDPNTEWPDDWPVLDVNPEDSIDLSKIPKGKRSGKKET